MCSRDLQDRSILPFGGPGIVVKCDESKFNHKPKVTPFYYLFRRLQFLSSFVPGKLFAFRNGNCPRTDIRSHFRAKQRLIFIQPVCFNFAGHKDVFQSVLRSLSTQISMKRESMLFVTMRLPNFWAIKNSFSNSFFEFYCDSYKSCSV